MSSDYALLLRNPHFAGRHRIEITGLGPTNVVLANGFGTNHGVWRRLLPWLEERARVVRFDWAVDPGHYDTLRYRHIESYAEDLLAVIRHAEAAPPLVVAHSMGAMIAMLAGMMEPETLRHVAMIAPSPCYRSEEGYQGGFTPEDITALLADMGRNYHSWAARFAPYSAGPGALAEDIEDFTASLQAMRPDVALSIALTIFRTDLRGRLDDYRVPTTILQPTHDPAVPVAVGAYLAARWPQSRLRIIEAAGHLPHLTAPEAVIDAIADLF